MTYSGNKILNWNTFFIAVFVPFILFVAPAPKHKEVLFYAVMLPLLYLIFLSQAFYFIIENDLFIIRNYGMPLIAKTYPFSNIESITLFGAPKSFSHASLQVKANGKKSIGFRAASLRRSDWHNLIAELKNKNVIASVSGYVDM